MGPIGFNVNDMMGGGLGALWAGQDKGLAQQNTQAGTQNLLEQIATAQQQRGFNEQMNPLKLEHQRMVNQEAPLMLEERRLGMQERKEKLNRENTLAAMDIYMRFATGGAEDAALLQGISKQYGIPENHPILGLMAQQYAKAGPKGVKALSERIASGGMKETEQRSREMALLERTNATNKAQMDRTLAMEEGKDRRLREQLQMRLRLEAKRGNDAIKIRDFQTAMLAYTAAYEAAVQAGDEAAAKQAATLLQQARQMANTAAEQKATINSPMVVPGLNEKPMPKFGGGGKTDADPLNLGL